MLLNSKGIFTIISTNMSLQNSSPGQVYSLPISLWNLTAVFCLQIQLAE